MCGSPMLRLFHGDVFPIEYIIRQIILFFWLHYYFLASILIFLKNVRKNWVCFALYNWCWMIGNISCQHELCWQNGLNCMFSVPWCSECSLWNSSVCTPGIFRNVEYLVPLKTYWTIICILTNSKVIYMHRRIWKTFL